MGTAITEQGTLPIALTAATASIATDIGIAIIVWMAFWAVCLVAVRGTTLPVMLAAVLY
jgi:hypothetical protein